MTASVLITGAGGPAAISFLKAIEHVDVEVHMADMDPQAAGLYLVSPKRRALVPAGRATHFVDAVFELCRSRGIDVLVPTVDVELLPLARARQRFEAIGTRVLVGSERALESSLDKMSLAERLRDAVPVPVTRLASEAASFAEGDWPLVIKPRRGAGSRGVAVLAGPSELPQLDEPDAHLLQELLPGEEYSVDVLATPEGKVLAAVPRARLKIDSGVAVCSRTVRDPELIRVATRVVEELALGYISNVQLRRRADGSPALLEVNPRVPGTLPLTVEAGVNMPLHVLLEALGKPTPAVDGSFREIAVVRYLEEVFVSIDELSALEAPVVVEAAE